MSGALELDHVVIGVTNLEAAVAAARLRGFSVTIGGRHRGFGTRNMLIRFRTAYLELITVTDPVEARASGRGTLVDRLEEHGDGLVAYALRTGSVDTLLRRASRTGNAMTGPVHMTRSVTAVRAAPQPPEAAWTLAKPFGDQYGGWWPFFIEWQHGGPGSDAYSCTAHPNGATRIADIDVIASDLDDVATWMWQVCGVRAQEGSPACARARTYELRNASLRFVQQPVRPVPTQVVPRSGIASVGLAAKGTREHAVSHPSTDDSAAAVWLDQVTISEVSQ